MILDRLEHSDLYAPLHPLFARAFAFLRETDLAALPLGRQEIDSKDLFAIAAREPGRSRAQAPLEAHRKYIDIQVVLAGTDEMGWKPLSRCTSPDVPYDAAADIEFFASPPDAWVAVEAGAFAVFFPEDAHAPLVGKGEIHKVVVKVAVATAPA